MEGFDFAIVTVGGVFLALVVFGLTEFFKDLFKLEGNKVRFLAVFLGMLIMALWEIRVFLVPLYAQIYTIAVVAITAGLTAGGYYQYKNKLDRKPPVPDTPDAVLEAMLRGEG